MKERRLTDDEKHQIKSLREAGLTQKRIAKILNISIHTVRRYSMTDAEVKEFKKACNMRASYYREEARERKRIYDHILDDCEQL